MIISYLSSLFDGKIGKLFGRKNHRTIGSEEDLGSGSVERILPSHRDNIRKTTNIQLDFVSIEASPTIDHEVRPSM